MDFAVPADCKLKTKENEKRHKSWDFTRQLKKPIEYKGANDTNFNWCGRNDNQSLLKGVEELQIGGQVETIQSVS